MLGIAALVRVHALDAVAQADIEIVKEGARKSAFDLSDLRMGAGRAGTEFRATLEQDLVRSGWFRMAAAGRGTLTLRGSVDGDPLTVRAEVLNRETGRCYLRSSFVGGDGARRAAHRLADEIVQAVAGVPGFASMRIAMIGAHGVRKDVFVCDSDGRNMTQVTHQGAVCLSPKWWPDGEALVYTSFHNNFPDIYRIDLAAKRRTKLAGFPGLNTGAAISPDGDAMALILSKDGNPELYVMDLRSRRLTRMTVSPHAAEASPTWSPDGKQIAFVSDSSGSPQVYVLTRQGKSPVRISLRGRENVAPDWGPDGRIAYSSRREGRYQLCVFDPASRRTEQVTDDYVDHEDPSWAPNGRHLVYTRTVNYRSALYLLDTMGDAPVRLTTMQGDWYSPACSTR